MVQPVQQQARRGRPVHKVLLGQLGLQVHGARLVMRVQRALQGPQETVGLLESQVFKVLLDQLEILDCKGAPAKLAVQANKAE